MFNEQNITKTVNDLFSFYANTVGLSPKQAKKLQDYVSQVQVDFMDLAGLKKAGANPKSFELMGFYHDGSKLLVFRKDMMKILGADYYPIIVHEVAHVIEYAMSGDSNHGNRFKVIVKILSNKNKTLNELARTAKFKPNTESYKKLKENQLI